MLDGINFNYKTILEPSAGKGDIAKIIKNKSNKCHIHLIELEPELQEIAKQYGQIVHYDFLTFEPDTQYDYIIMNPPFDNGDAHLLKAWEIATNTKIICLLNAETIRNPYSKTRQALKAIIEQHWTVEYIQDAFVNAERKTNVEVALIRLTKKSDTAFDFQNFETECEYHGELSETALANPYQLNNMLQDYKRAKELFAEWVAKIRKAQTIVKQFSHVNALDIASKSYSTNDAVQEFSDRIRSDTWNKITNLIGLEKYMTAKVLEAFQNKMKEQKNIALTKNNIEVFIQSIMLNGQSILEESITNAFDLMTRYDVENRFEPEGWKHNSSYMVNKKVVIPGVMSVRNYGSWDQFQTLQSYTNRRAKELEDIDRALCFMTGTKFEDSITTLQAINNAIWNDTTKTQSTFFQIQFYKKGTVHITFLSQKVWVDFNLRATKNKNWLPPSQENKWRQSNKFD